MQNLEHWPLTKLVEYARNPRKNDHAVDKVAAAIREFGFRVPIVAKSDGTIVDGHLRFKAARKLNLDTVPVLLADDMTPSQVKAFRISVNKVAELAEWDDELLQLEISELRDAEFDLSVIGFDDGELDRLLASMEAESEGIQGDEDDAPEVQAQAVTVRGDVWLCGRHRVMCGDSGIESEIDKLMGVKKADFVYTDPPYGIALMTDYKKIGHGKSNSYSTILNDDKLFDPTLILTKFKSAKECFIWGADNFCTLLPLGGSWIVWDKSNPGMDKFQTGDFELCWSRERHKYAMFRKLWAGFTAKEKDEKRVHPTQKPVEMATWFFEKWGSSISVVADLYLGSGSTLIAAEKAGKECCGMELSPAYVDVIVRRWQTATGKQATLESTGQTFANVEAERL